MKEYKQRLFIAIVVTLVAVVVINFYETYVDSAKYNIEHGYIDNLDEISEVYKNMNDFILHIEEIGFMKTDTHEYERSYNKFMCEKVKVNGDNVEFYISDSCLSVYENEIKNDFNNDGINILYFVDENGKFSYLKETGENNAFQQYDLSMGTFELQGELINEYDIVKYNNAYSMFLKQVNALLF